MRLFLVLLTVLFSAAVQAEDGDDSFLEGFPDVPRLAVIRAIDGDPVVFDTPSGTVAEITLLLTGTGDNALKLYRESLTALGWDCKQHTARMRCEREKDRLIFTDVAHGKADGKLVLRLEPKQ